MSSILRALKKLDEDAASSENGAGAQQVTMRRMVDRKTRAPRFMNRLFFVSLVLLMVSAAVWFITNWKHSAPEPEPVIEPVVSSPKSPALPVTPADSKAPVESDNKAPVGPVAPNNKAPVGSPPVTRINNKVPVAFNDKAPVEPANKTPVGPVAAPQLVLSGVLWSDNPAKRMALINGRYLKEGDKIEGAVVFRIGKKTVTMKSGDRKWTVNLKR